MKKYDAILFDLDGTLLPMDMNVFMKEYFKNLCANLSYLGLDAKTLTDCVWAGTAAMVKNDGKRKNGEVFWETFQSLVKTDLSEAKNTCDEFYTKDFNKSEQQRAKILLQKQQLRQRARLLPK